MQFCQRMTHSNAVLTDYISTKISAFLTSYQIYNGIKKDLAIVFKSIFLNTILLINNNKCNGLFAVFSDVNDDLFLRLFPQIV